MLTRSYWEDRLYFGHPDFIVIGAGLVGMYTAYFLKLQYPDADILVVERGSFGEGASTKNAGFACFGSVSELLEDIDTFGREMVKDTLQMRWQGIQLTRSILRDENIGYEEVGGTEVFTTEDKELREKCKKSLADINSLVREAIGMPGVFEFNDGSPKGTKDFDGYIFNRLEGSLDTSKFNSALYSKCLSQKIRFLYGFKVESVTGGSNPYISHTVYGKIEAKAVFVTINGFANDLVGGLDVKPVRNQVIVTEEIRGLGLKGCFHMDRGYFYFRNVDKRIMIGGGRNKLGANEETAELAQTEEALELLKNILDRYITGAENVKIDYHWSGILGIGSNKKPIITQQEPGIFLGVRMGGMGVAICSVVGKQLAELSKSHITI